jgi:endonuclease/exonuclease/phosphatase family metal-dependent hydrolase
MEISPFKRQGPLYYWLTGNTLRLFGNDTIACFFVALCLFLFSLSAISSGQITNEKRTKKNEVLILTYNVRNCHGLDDSTNYQRVADIIIRINPQIVAIQELDSATLRSNGMIALNELAVRTGMYSVYGATINYLGGKYGNGVLCKEKPVSWKSVPLPGREEKRSVLIVEFEDYIFCCTHFSLNAEDRLKSAEIINDLFQETSKHVFLAGDLNSLQDSYPVKNLEKKWLMLNNSVNYTIPSDYPRRCIDYIFALKNTNHSYKVEKTMVEKEPLASDHLPVWVLVKIKK